MSFTLPMVQDKASSPFQVTPALKSKKAKKGKSKRRQQQAQGQVFDPVKLQQGIAENQQEILQTPAAKRRNRDAEDPFKNGFFKTNEQRREIEKKYSSVPNLRIDKNQEPAPGQTPAQKLFAPATPSQQAAPQPNDPKATAEYRDRMAKHRQANTAQALAPQQKQKSFNQGALTDQEYAAMEAKAAMAKNRASSVPLPDPSRYQKALATASSAQNIAALPEVNEFTTNAIGSTIGNYQLGQLASGEANQAMDELAQAAADWERQNSQFDQNISRGSVLPQANPAGPSQSALPQVPPPAPQTTAQAPNLNTGMANTIPVKGVLPWIGANFFDGLYGASDALNNNILSPINKAFTGQQPPNYNERGRYQDFLRSQALPLAQ